MILIAGLFLLSVANADTTLSDYCEKSLQNYTQKQSDAKILKEACAQVELRDECRSVEGLPIFHYDRKGSHTSKQKILVFSLIHGDEVPAGSVGRFWMERLQSIDPRNSWRVIPILNPDGVKLKTRTNANKVDINRNFPTQDWQKEAVSYWKKTTSSNPRRFPGEKAASEPETRCAIAHIEDFKPDFVVSIHTPLKVLDFDGPRIKPPKFDYLPWKTLGNYPGSLGRYLWLERKTPVLTAEFKEDTPPAPSLVQLQDVIGFLVSLEISSGKPETGKTETVKSVIDKSTQNKSAPSKSAASKVATSKSASDRIIETKSTTENSDSKSEEVLPKPAKSESENKFEKIEKPILEKENSSSSN